MTVISHLQPGKSDEHFTPPEIFEALGCTFDLDPCQPENGRAFLSVPCRKFYTKSDDGLTSPWSGFVWMNPPFGPRNGVVPWLEKFFNHGNGIALVSAQTSCGWFHDFAPKASCLLFPNGKTKFIQADGSIARQPPMGVVLMGIGSFAEIAMKRAERKGLGMLVWSKKP